MILSKLRIHGLTSSQEEAILAGLLSGEPILLIGPPGTAKTEIINAVGSALREESKKLNPDGNNLFDYQVYDASKVNFEELFGIPDIKALQQDPPQVRYIKTPSSIWGKHLIAFDELNRCPEDRQSNLFEIIRSRKLYGVPTGNLFIFSTINPFGDTGTVQMSDALVDRHMLFVKFDRFENMSSDNRRQVISRVGDKEGLGFTYWGGEKSEFSVDDTSKTYNEVLASIGQEIRSILLRANKYRTQLAQSLNSGIVQIIDKVVENMASSFNKESISVKNEVCISGRRAASIARAILSIRAIQLATKQEGAELPDIISTIINTIRLALPIGIGGKLNQDIIDRANKVVEDTVKTVWPSIKLGKDTVDIDTINEILSTNNPIRILDALLSSNINVLTRETAFSYLLDKNRYISSTKPTTAEENNYNRIKVLLYSLNEAVPNFLPPHINLELTPTIIDLVQAREQHEVDAIIIDYKPYIETMLKLYSSNPLIYFAAKTAILHFWPNIKTDQMAIEALVSIKRLADSVAKKLLIHQTTNNDTTSTINNPIT